LLGDRGDYRFYKVDRSNFQGFINHVIGEVGYAAETHYDEPIQQVLGHYFPASESGSWGYDDPVFCTYLTDGAPNPEKTGRLAKGLIAQAAAKGMPIFFKFLALHGETRNFQLLQEIDDDKQRRFDNTDFVPVQNPESLTMQDIINEFRGFILEANKLGCLNSNYGIPKKYLNAEDRVKSNDSETTRCRCVIQ